MSTIVLVHGSFHGGWCWERVAPRLAASGHRVVTPDLPGRGGDGAQTLDAYATHIADRIAAEPEPVLLVGHSMGGVVVTAVAERIPERLAGLVYVCGFMPASGQSLLDLAKTDTESVLMRHLAFDEARGVHWVRPEGARASFYHDCPEADAEAAARRLGAESLAVVATPVATTSARFGRVSRLYIECTDDRALGPALQRRMCAAQPCRVERLATGHSPFYAQPEALAGILGRFDPRA